MNYTENPSTKISLEEFRSLVESTTGIAAKRVGSGYSACCPAHDDTHPSLSFSESSDGTILAKCFSGCSFEDICLALGVEKSALFPDNTYNNYADTRIQTKYEYRDEQGFVIFSKIRVEPGFDGKSKSFFFEREGENGEIIKNISGCRRILYRLPELLSAIAAGEKIFLVEGEKDVETLFNNGLVATTTTDSLQWHDDFTFTLKDADVVVLYDMDKTGYDRRDLLCKNLYNKVFRLRVVDLPGLHYKESHGEDLSDWLKKGAEVSDLLKLVDTTPNYAPTPKQHTKSRIKVVTAVDFLKTELPKKEMLLSPFLPHQGLAMLYAKRGVGKTYVALSVAYAIATGGTFLKWSAPKPKKVLYFDGEMPAVSMQERLRKITNNNGNAILQPDFLQIVTPDIQESSLPDFSTEFGRAEVEKIIDGIDLVIIDNISSLFRSGNENEAESWQYTQDWILDLRRRGKTVLFIHHSGKGGQQRGTSKKEDILDSVINLKLPEDYRADQGARFEVHYEKTRNFHGDEASPFLAQLTEDELGNYVWLISEIGIDADIPQIAELVKSGLTISDIAKKTGLTKSQVETRRNKAKEKGLC